MQVYKLLHMIHPIQQTNKLGHVSTMYVIIAVHGDSTELTLQLYLCLIVDDMIHPIQQTNKLGHVSTMYVIIAVHGDSTELTLQL